MGFGDKNFGGNSSGCGSCNSNGERDTPVRGAGIIMTTYHAPRDVPRDIPRDMTYHASRDIPRHVRFTHTLLLCISADGIFPQ